MIRASSLTTKHLGKNKLLLGFVGVAASAVIGTAGVAAAHPATPNMAGAIKTACTDWRSHHFRNHGQCVSSFEHELHNKQKHGHGYGGGSGYGGNGNTVSTGVNVNVSGDNNVINIVINYFFGH